MDWSTDKFIHIIIIIIISCAQAADLVRQLPSTAVCCKVC